jgi:hypothetical protein
MMIEACDRCGSEKRAREVLHHGFYRWKFKALEGD